LPDEIPAARIARMRKLLNERDVLSSREAQAEFQVSEMTVRRDFAALVRAGHARRTRGGIVLADLYFRDRPQAQRLTLEPDAKRSIATSAARLVEDGDTIFLGGGTTCLALARELGARRNLTVITYSVAALVLLMANPDIEVFVPGGLASPKGDELTGPLAEAGLRRFRARKAFIGAAGVTVDGTFNSNVLRGSVDATVVAQSTEVYVLADHTKIGRVSLVSVIGLEQVSAIVTDRPVRETDSQWLSKANVRVIAPGESPGSASRLGAAREDTWHGPEVSDNAQ
jgi:DeoR family transcriptional regulator, fructose operon transcriptional repressor